MDNWLVVSPGTLYWSFFSLSILLKFLLRRGLLHNAEGGSRGERKSSGEIDWVDL